MGTRQTKQKTILEEEAAKFTTFFDADALYSEVEKRQKGIGIATIYRFLKEAVKNRELHQYTCERKTIYSNSKKSHSHFTCEVCGKTKHIEVKELNFLKKSIKEHVCHFQLNVSGICTTCKTNRT